MTNTLIVYEHPFTEHTRTLLRLESLHERFAFFINQENFYDHHAALMTFFEIWDIASRNDLRNDLIKELDKQRKSLTNLLGNPNVEITALEAILHENESLLHSIGEWKIKTSQSSVHDEWLNSIRSRAFIPGGTCNFDLPSYHAWQHFPGKKRKENLYQWIHPFLPLCTAAQFILRLTRQAGKPVQILAQQGCYQQMLAGKNFRLFQVKIEKNQPYIPETSANKYMVWVRFLKQNNFEKPIATTDDVPFIFSLCDF